MQKIIDLVKQIGASDELANSLCEAVTHYASEVEARNRAKFDKILAKAKGLCVEFVEKEVANNARKLKVFIESKERDFADAADRARKLEESESLATLKQVSALLNGGETPVNTEAMREIGALKVTSTRLEEAYKTLRTENAKLASALNRSNTLAERTVEKCKTYRSKLARAGLLGESGASAPAKRPVTESRRPTSSRGKRVIGESRRRSSRPATTRAPVRRGGKSLASSDPMVNEVAENMNADV